MFIRTIIATAVASVTMGSVNAYIPHSTCSTPNVLGMSNTDANKIEVDQCTTCYRETLLKLAKEEGTDMVLGANDGISYDPAWAYGYWKAVPHHKIVWVEPIPELYRKLKNNTAHIENKLLLNIAVRPNSMEEDELDFVCWDLKMIDNVLLKGVADPIPTIAGSGVKAYWRALCSSTQRALTEASDLYRGKMWSSQPEADKKRIIQDVNQYIIHYRVDALKPADIVSTYNLKNFNYLQIDVEGLDNEIIKSLPLGVDGFYPKMILYENHQGYAMKEFLESHGYHVCCCLQHLGSNIVAVYVGNPNLKL